jgi:purine-nucleoside phosphorylase
MYDYERLEQYAEKISTKIGFQPRVGLVLGTGLGEMAEKMTVVYEQAFTDFSGFPVSTVEGHIGHFLFGYFEDVPVVCMQGRVHYYEGYSMEDVVLPIRFMAIMGVESIILTNAAGGINKDFNVGDIMVITDHISSFVPNPLIGKNVDNLGIRFPDMSNIYDKQMREAFVTVAKQNGIPVREGVYIQFTGPSFESPA